MPSHRIGNDGFSWWVGQIEGSSQEEENNKGGYRYKVRIVGDHPKSKEVLDTKDLPWANVMMPVNVPFMPGNIGGASSQLIRGCWVIGFYLDNDRQKPIIMGSIGVTPGATSKLNTPGPDREPFVSGPEALHPIDAAKDGVEGEDGTAKTGGGLSTGRKRGDGQPDVPVPPALAERPSKEKWCQEVAEKCKDPDLKTQMTGILGELLANIQNSGGNIGDFYVNKVTGGLNSVIYDARIEINKAVRVVTEFLARVKGFIKTKLQEGVDALVKAVLRPDESGNALTPVTEFFNNALKNLGCEMADLGQRLIDWLTNVLMSYVNEIYRSVVCQVDELVNGIISKFNQLLEELLNKVLGPLQDILGAIAEPLNIIGGAINFILKLLGISCSGPDQTCNKYKRVCTDGEKKKDEDDKNFLDNLLSDIDNLFGDTPADYTQYVCDEAYTGNPLTVTTVGFTGGIPLPPGESGKKVSIVYDVNDIEVTRGKVAVFTVTRSGYTAEASSITYKTLDKGTATPDEDYLKVNESVLGFTPGETSKTIEIQTLSTGDTDDEDFYISLKKNTPLGIPAAFKKNTAKCDIKALVPDEPSDPYLGKPINPITGIPPVFDDGTFPPDEDGDGTPDNEDDDIGTIGDGTDTTQTYKVVADRSTCPEGEFIVYTITTKNVDSGSILYYTLSGPGITKEDIVGGSLAGSFIINDNTAKVTIGIEEDDVVEEAELLTFSINGQGASVDVLITVADDQDIGDFDEGVGDSPDTDLDPGFKQPSINIDDVITDENGGIIEIPVDDPGDPYAEPPFVFIGGNGFGANATALLDANGFLTEIRIVSPGFGYKKNLAANAGKRCIIDSFTTIKPGVGYVTAPDVYVDGELGIAEAVINDDGFVIGARMLDRTKVFNSFPEILIVGGGGYGARLLPSLLCLDTDGLSKLGSTKIGTGRYVDCP